MEIRDLYDADKCVTGKTFVKGEQVPAGYYYLIVAIIIENSRGEFLVQKRVLRKGCKWALTAGHPKSGESSLEGLITEVFEEIGIDIRNDNLILFETWNVNDQFFDIYYLKKDIDINDIKIQEEEVDGVMFSTASDIKKMYKEGIFHDNHYQLFLKCLNYLVRE